MNASSTAPSALALPLLLPATCGVFLFFLAIYLFIQDVIHPRRGMCSPERETSEYSTQKTSDDQRNRTQTIRNL